MDIGVCVIHRENGIESSLLGISEAGFGSCQLMSWDRRLWTAEQSALILGACEKYGVRITALFCGWSGPTVWDFYSGQETLGMVPPVFRAERMNQFLEGARFAHSLGVKDVITHVGFIPENPHDHVYISLVDTLRYIVSILGERGQFFLFETGQETPVTLLRTIEDIGRANIGVNLDPANLILYGKGNPVDALDVIGPLCQGSTRQERLLSDKRAQSGPRGPARGGQGKLQGDDSKAARAGLFRKHYNRTGDRGRRTAAGYPERQKAARGDNKRAWAGIIFVPAQYNYGLIRKQTFYTILHVTGIYFTRPESKTGDITLSACKQYTHGRQHSRHMERI